MDQTWKRNSLQVQIALLSFGVHSRELYFEPAKILKVLCHGDFTFWGKRCAEI